MSANRLNPVLDAIVSRVASITPTLPGVEGVLPVMKRKAAVRRSSMDPRAMVTVSKSSTPERVTRRRFVVEGRAGAWQTAYRVDVIVHAPYRGPDADQPEHALLRDRIVDLFKAPPLANAEDVFEMDAQPADWLRPMGETTEYDWQSLQVTATVAHD